jgi:hypothetical protein
MCNVVQFFDKSCAATLNESGYPVLNDYFVSSKAELEDKVRAIDFERALLEQKTAWLHIAQKEKSEVLGCLSALLTNH